MATVTVSSVPFSRYHQRILAIALYTAKPKTTDRDRMDDWVNMCAEIGNAIREQGGQFDMSSWLDVCYHGPK
jgi:hypothetical protein